MKNKLLIWFVPGMILLLFWFSLSGPLFHDPTSTVLLDNEGQLLGAKIANDHQWRFPESEKIPEKFSQAIIHFEDRKFRYHPGFNPVALIRALHLNNKKHKIVSGGSTITMQLIRLSRKNKPRTYAEKFIELILAFRLELTHSKADILRLYASHAPFGGNVVGLDAASWRYFGKDADHLSWAESATLAVLPNSPGLIYPGRNLTHLLEKRDRLLNILYQRSIIDSVTCVLAKSEPLPGKPFPLPQWAPHLLERAVKEGNRGKIITSTVNHTFQERITSILKMHAIQLRANQINNAAALVLEVNTGKVLAYIGNLTEPGMSEKGKDVDIITAPRSTGSILKPFLYAAMLHEGLLLPNSLIPDIPMQIGGFIPENFTLGYDGAVPASRALSRSLNIPAVKMLQTYGYDPFCNLLRNIGMTTLTKPADHYGLSLILGGAEANLWDLTGIYASMARTLNHFSSTQGKYSKTDFHSPYYKKAHPGKPEFFSDRTSWFDAASIWLTLEAMVEVARPDEELQWQRFGSGTKIAWKTGTSFGNRDAWSIGVTPEYVVGVWVGNASGEGRPGLTGIGVAAPILFDIFKILPTTSWFPTPYDDMVFMPVCHYSGYRASSLCEWVDTLWVQKKGVQTESCPYHQIVHLDKSGKWQVNSNCESPENMQHVSWFVLPPVIEWYFRNKNPFYKILPPFRLDCMAGGNTRNMDMIYPKSNSKIYVPVDLDGKTGSSIFKLAHRDPEALVYWHLDKRFIGSTVQLHQMAISPEKGMHHLTLIDQKGETLNIRFEILTKDDRR